MKTERDGEKVRLRFGQRPKCKSEGVKSKTKLQTFYTQHDKYYRVSIYKYRNKFIYNYIDLIYI